MSFSKNAETEQLLRAILSLQNVQECYNFFEDLCTVPELLAMSQRFEVARLLNKGCSYAETLEQTGVSSATVGRVSRCVKYGAGGYTLALERMGQNDADTAL